MNQKAQKHAILWRRSGAIRIRFFKRNIPVHIHTRGFREKDASFL